LKQELALYICSPKISFTNVVTFFCTLKNNFPKLESISKVQNPNGKVSSVQLHPQKHMSDFRSAFKDTKTALS